MIYLNLFIGFLKVGCFAFGGAYGAIPLIREVVLSYGWLTDEAFSYMVAVGESTPGPIMVNLATYVGRCQGGLPGAVLATAAVVLPSFVIILLVMVVFRSLIRTGWFQALLKGMKPCIVGIILATGVYMTAENILPGADRIFCLRDLIMTAVLALILYCSKPVIKKKVSPITLIIISAVLGAAVYSI